MIDTEKIIKSILQYGITKELIDTEDEIYIRNKLMSIFRIKSFHEEANDIPSEITINNIVGSLKMWAYENNEEYISLENKVMDTLLDKPSIITKKFYENLKRNPIEATSYFYKLSVATNIVKSLEIKKNIVWKYNSRYGEIVLSINCSKPEIINTIGKRKLCNYEEYPKCVLCKEMEGYYGNMKLQPKVNHRIIPLYLTSGRWHIFYSPYAYFNEHMIIASENHKPMNISKDTFRDILELVDIFKHYMIGSNADLRIVGGSLLKHNHYQGGRVYFPLYNAKQLYRLKIEGYDDIEVSRLDWPMTVIRLRGKSIEKLVKLSDVILDSWRSYSNKELGIVAFSNNENHNTITPIGRFVDDEYEINLTLRCNIVSELYPDGVFSPHKEIQNIKKENIGLIEVLGYAVLPGRLVKEIESMKEYLLDDSKRKELSNFNDINSHIDFLNNILKNRTIEEDSIENIIYEEIAKVFVNGLEQCNVFEYTAKGEEGFRSFINSFNSIISI